METTNFQGIILFLLAVLLYIIVNICKDKGKKREEAAKLPLSPNISSNKPPTTLPISRKHATLSKQKPQPPRIPRIPRIQKIINNLPSKRDLLYISILFSRKNDY